MRSGAAAAAWLEQRTSFPLDEDGITQCMRAVLMAYDLIPIGGYGSAMDGWRLNGISSTIANASFRRGTVHYFRGPFGHVGIATGNGTEVRSTGVRTTGMLTATAAEMARLTGDPYLGYATSFSGTPISFTTTAGTGSTTVEDPAEAARLERIRRAKGMSYLCTPTTDWKTRPLMAGTKTPLSVVWNGPTSTLIDTPAKLTAAQRMLREDEERKIVSEADWAWLTSLIPSGTPGAPGDNAAVLAAIAKVPTAEQNGAAARAAIIK